jgi:hypothetical protein
MVTNQPINCYGVTDRERGQKVLWSSQFINRPPINFIHVDGNHYVALLPYYDETMLNQRYSYQGRFMSDIEHQAFRTRLSHQIPPNEVVDEDQGDMD